MKRKAIIIFLLLSFIAVSSYAQQNKVDVTYVGNAGFLIQIGDKKILIDALFKGFEGNYELPQEIQEKLTQAQAPFNDVDLILVTHAHGDHIHPDMVKQHMRNNPKAIFASTKQLIDHMKDSSDRSIGFNPTKEKSDKKEIQGFSIETFLLPHGTDARIINIGFLVSVNGITLFHTGDVDFDQFTFEEFRSLQLPERKIDLSFIQHFYLGSDSTSRQFITKGIAGKYIVPIHYHFTTPGFDEAIVKANYPDAILFDKELESWEMPDKRNDFTIQKGYYFHQDLPGDSAVIFAPGIVSVNGRYEYGSHGFIAPSQDFILIDARKENDKTKDKDIHVCFKKKDGTWTKPINLGREVNSNFNETCPSITSDGKYLFFSRYNEEAGLPNIYWVSTHIIKRLKEKAMQEAALQKFTNLKGDYFGQTPPGDVPMAVGDIDLNG